LVTGHTIGASGVVALSANMAQYILTESLSGTTFCS